MPNEPAGATVTVGGVTWTEQNGRGTWLSAKKGGVVGGYIAGFLARIASLEAQLARIAELERRVNQLQYANAELEREPLARFQQLKARLARLSRGAAKVQEIRNERGVHHYYDVCNMAPCTCGATELKDAIDEMLGANDV